MPLKLPSISSQWIIRLFLYCAFSFALCLTDQSVTAQDQEAGSTTSQPTQQSGVELPGDPAAEKTETDSEELKQDERPKELGVMILIVWLLAGAGIGILIFTSLFGHSVRSMIRRPYPNHMYPPKKEKPEPPVETSTEAETGDEKPES
ncbi:hypothetical protein [Gimesia algae]|nr:hypothetical protein [Gimesia algae]